MRKIAVLLLITLLWAGSAYAADGVVSLNFENWGGAPTGASPTAGVVDVPYWNDTWLDNQKNSPMTDLRDSTGATTTIDVAWVSGGEWGVNLWNDTGNDDDGRRNVAIMKGFIDANQNQTPDTCTVDISEIPYDYYDLYVYVMSDTQNRVATVTDGTTTYYLLTDPQSLHFSGDPLSADYVEFKQGTATDAESAVNANYVVFSTLSGATQQIVTYSQFGAGIAAIQIVEVGPPTGPSEPFVTPDNGDGTVGNLVDADPSAGVDWQIQDVTLHFIAAKDPNVLHEPQYTINPDIIQHNIWLQTGAPDDPNLYLYDSVEANIVDPYTHDPNVSYGPLPNNLLAQGTTYEWQVEEVIDNGAGGYPTGDPNNIVGPVWSFTTASATPEILSISDHQLTDANGNATLTIETGAVANNYRWFKVVGQQDTEENAEGNDEMLTDGGLYSTTTTKTLTITGMATNGSDDNRYYAIAYNGDPQGAAILSPPSAVRWVWYPRETSHYAFEDMDTSVDPNGVTTDSISGYNMAMKSNDIGGEGPVLDSNAYIGSSSLFFNNPNDGGDPNFVDAQYAQISEPYVGTYKDITISAWVYFKGGNWSRIIDLGNSAGNSTFITAAYNNTPGNLRFAVDTPSAGEQNVSSAGAVPLNEWVYITATLTDNTGKLFVNGEYIAQNTNITSDPLENGATTNNYVGRSQYNDPYYDGYIDELRIWNYGLTTDQVAQAYLADSGVEYVCDTEANDLLYDYNGNCIIDLGDFAVIAATWMENHRILP